MPKVMKEFPKSGIGASSPTKPPSNPSKILKQQDNGINDKIHTFGNIKRYFAFRLSFVSINCPVRKIPVPNNITTNPTPTAKTTCRSIQMTIEETNPIAFRIVPARANIIALYFFSSSCTGSIPFKRKSVVVSK